MNYTLVKDQIVAWLINQAENAGQNGFIVGVSGGIDSAVVSTLCAETKLSTLVISLPINQDSFLAQQHMSWLTKKYSNVTDLNVSLDDVYNPFKQIIEQNLLTTNPLVLANLQSRLRMCALYSFANACRYLVVGTGNKIEDYGIGFFTKYGDGGIDLSPIGDLLKSDVRELAILLNINQEIIKAAPTDGLWEDGRTDEDQIGATYEELEWAMKWFSDKGYSSYDFLHKFNPRQSNLNKRQIDVLFIYDKRHRDNLHKMMMPPICSFKGSVQEEDTEVDDDRLLPCPLCGGKAKMGYYVDGIDNWVYCSECSFGRDNLDGEHDAISKWNSRFPVIGETNG